MQSMFIYFFDQFCLFIDDGVTVCGEGSNFQLVRGPQNCVLGHFQAEGTVSPKLLLKVV